MNAVQVAIAGDGFLVSFKLLKSTRAAFLKPSIIIMYLVKICLLLFDNAKITLAFWKRMEVLSRWLIVRNIGGS
jgi:hypothetical protein